jgi:hypothetical protein
VAGIRRIAKVVSDKAGTVPVFRGLKVALPASQSFGNLFGRRSNDDVSLCNKVYFAAADFLVH